MPGGFMICMEMYLNSFQENQSPVKRIPWRMHAAVPGGAASLPAASSTLLISAGRISMLLSVTRAFALLYHKIRRRFAGPAFEGPDESAQFIVAKYMRHFLYLVLFAAEITDGQCFSHFFHDLEIGDPFFL